MTFFTSMPAHVRMRVQLCVYTCKGSCSLKRPRTHNCSTSQLRCSTGLLDGHFSFRLEAGIWTSISFVCQDNKMHLPVAGNYMLLRNNIIFFRFLHELATSPSPCAHLGTGLVLTCPPGSSESRPLQRDHRVCPTFERFPRMLQRTRLLELRITEKNPIFFSSRVMQGKSPKISPSSFLSFQVLIPSNTRIPGQHMATSTPAAPSATREAAWKELRHFP